MGEYTAMRCRASIKPEYHALIQKIIDAWNDHAPFRVNGNDWMAVRELAVQYPILAELAACDRGSVFFGNFLGDHPVSEDAWDPTDEEWKLAFKDGVLKLYSCFKNYNNEIDRWAQVLDIIAEPGFYLAKWNENHHGGPSEYSGRWTQYPDYGPVDKPFGIW